MIIKYLLLDLKHEYKNAYFFLAVSAETEELSLEQQQQAATKIQAAFRGMHARERVKQLKAEKVRPLYLCKIMFVIIQVCFSKIIILSQLL